MTWRHPASQLLAAGLITAALALLSLAGARSAAAHGAAVRTDPLLAPLSACPGSDQFDAPAPAQLKAMACLVAYVRAQAGLSTLRETKTLDRAATLKIAADVQCDQFSHTPCGRSLQSVFASAGYPLGGSYSIGENIAFGQDQLGSPLRIMAAWLKSPDHRANLLDPTWTTFGLGVQAGSTFLGYPGVNLWANDFAGK